MSPDTWVLPAVAGAGVLAGFGAAILAAHFFWTQQNWERAVLGQKAMALQEPEGARSVEESTSEDAAIALVTVLQRMAPQAAGEKLAVRVELPSEEMKAKLIGREGRNIRAFENTTGADLIIDETPDAVSVSCWDPFRREAARFTLVQMLLDGRIHPGMIEELYKETVQEMEARLPRLARSEAANVGVAGLAPEVWDALGRMRLMESEGQNLWQHSLECAHIVQLAAGELGLSCGDRAATAALLHDVGKTVKDAPRKPHALAGMDFLKPHLSDERVLNAVGAHHFDIPPLHVESHLVIFADRLSASRPGARIDGEASLKDRLKQIEETALRQAGVERAYAVQAGRELRVLVRPGDVADDELRPLARLIADELARRVEYPGGIKVTVLRETQASELTP